MSQVVYNDTPLAEYLGDLDVEDWGIDFDFQQAPPPASPPERDATKAQSITYLKPLKLSPTSNYTRSSRIHAVLRRALNPELSIREIQRFYEHFHYLLISSRLLEQKPLFSVVSKSSDERRLDLLETAAREPFKLLYTDPKHFVGGGGCVVLIAVLLGWKIKQTQKECETVAKMAVVLTLCVALYFYAHSRRRLLRLMHVNALVFLDEFTKASHTFDGDVVRALKAIQQVEVVDRSYSSGAQANARSCKRLRLALSSCLNLAVESLLDAIKDVLQWCKEADIHQHINIYELAPAQQRLEFVMNDDFVGFLHDTNRLDGASTPLSSLKLQFERVHFLRRALFCCLLATPASGKCSAAELEAWGTITDHLKTNRELFESLCGMLSKERFYSEPETFNGPVQAPQSQDRRSSLVKLNILSQFISSRMELVANTSLGDQELSANLVHLNNDIAELSRQWSQLHAPEKEFGLGISLESSSCNDSAWSASASTIVESRPFFELETKCTESVLECVVEQKPRERLDHDYKTMDHQDYAAAESKFMAELGNVLQRRGDPLLDNVHYLFYYNK